MTLTPNQRALARLVAALADVDVRTAARAVLLGPERMRSARVREATGDALRELATAAQASPLLPTP